MNSGLRDAGVAQRADDRAGHRADVRAAVAADLGLVAHAADADALELAARARARSSARARSCRRRAARRSTGSSRGRRGFELAHGEELEDAVLDLLDVVVVLVEHLAGVREVEVVLGRLVPRQRRDPLQVGADDAVLGGLRRQALEPVELAVGLLADVLGQLDRRELLAQLAGLRRGLVDLAELLLDRLELLAQDVLALALVELGLDLRLDLRADRDDLELAREDRRRAGAGAWRRRPPRAAPASPRSSAAASRRSGGSARSGRRGWRPRSAAPRAGRAPARRSRVNVCWTLRISAVSSGDSLDDVGQLGDLGDEVGRLARPSASIAHALGALDEDPQRPVGHLHHPRDRRRRRRPRRASSGPGRLELGVLARRP